MSRSWQDFNDLYPKNTVVGTLKVLKDHHSPQLNNSRDLYVWLPPSYATAPEKRFPVVYMHDGQNIFDDSLSYIGEWKVDETLTALAPEGYEAIVVGVPNTGATRMNEYSPFDGYFGDGNAAHYLAYLTDTIKPLIDEDFRTKPDPEFTGLMGSSMGGLVSLYAVYASDVFGFAGVLSPAFYDDQGILDYLDANTTKVQRLYMDVGTREGANMVEKARVLSFSAEYLERVRRVQAKLVAQGLDDKRMFYVEDEGAIHREDAWSKRLPRALRFLLPKA